MNMKPGLICLVVGALAATSLEYGRADDAPAVVVEEETEVVVGEEVAVEENGTADSTWRALPVESREAEGEPIFIRQSTDAFVDPDSPGNLEPKYYFVLDEGGRSPVANLRRGPSLDPDTAIAWSTELASSELGIELPPTVGELAVHPRLHAEWIEQSEGAEAKSRHLALLAVPDASDTARLLVLKSRLRDDRLDVEKVVARRELPAEELPASGRPGALLDVIDPVVEPSAAQGLFGRVIAVLKRADNRFAVDFYGEKLRPSGDTRVLLTGINDALGQAQEIAFVDLPVQSSAGGAKSVTVLAAHYESAGGEPAQIAVDYPLARTPLMVQLKSLLDAASQGGGDPSSAGNLARLIGEDILDELAQRMVDAQY